MIDRYFSAPKTLRRLRSGPSGAYIDGFADALTRDGYAHASVVRYLRAAAHLGVFLGQRHKRLPIWTPPASARFVGTFDGVTVPPPMVAALAITRRSACSAFRPT